MTSSRRADFPLLAASPGLHYLDSAATSQKPQSVIDAVTRFYSEHNANIHRGVYAIAEEATARYEDVRGKVARILHAVLRPRAGSMKSTALPRNTLDHAWRRS